MELRYFREISQLINRETGIVFDERKKYFVEARVKEHMDELGIRSLRDYLVLLKTDRNVLEDFISKITVNETYFYREFRQLEAFGEIIKKYDGKRARVLSIPSSTGEEPYTLAIVVLELLEDPHAIHIVGVDIDKNAISKAKEGIYSERSVSRLPEPYLRKYFINLNGKWKIKDVVKRMVRFYVGNILDRDFMKSLGKFEVVFCRNLLIYFDEASRRKAVEHLYMVLENGGYLFLGSAESLSKVSPIFRPVRVKDAIAYVKEEEEDEW